jgi:tRNA 2-thiouridine synthesizing protein A
MILWNGFCPIDPICQSGEPKWKEMEYIESSGKEVAINGEKVKVALSIDAVGLFCPMPVVKLRLGLEMVNMGEVVELLADDPGVKDDFPAWCEETGNTILSLGENAEGFFVAYVKKRQGVGNEEN